MVSHMSIQEEAKLDAMQRAWQSRRGISSSLINDVATVEEVLLSIPPARQCMNPLSKVVASPPTYTCSDVESDSEILDIQEKIIPRPVVEPKESPTICLDASLIGDIPARYTIPAVEPHQMPVVGVYIDKRVVPGFKYRVRPLPAIGQKLKMTKCLFDEKALTLTSIGRGYARRFTFEADSGKLNNNKNYFWSDNRPEGYAFELELLSVGDKFTIFDSNNEAQGTVEVLNIQGPQIEVSNSLGHLGIEKRAKVKFTGKVESFETGVAKHMPLSGTVIALKEKRQLCATIVRVVQVAIKRQRCTLIPGIKTVHRRFTVRGSDINDIPTKYTMTGLEDYEIPVVGTYVDPRVIPGFYYKVRPNDRKEHLFGGRALKLMSIGMGYAKRLTFQPDSLVEPNNYLWSDNHPDGLGLEVRAVRKGMKFTITSDNQVLGEASVFRADKPQKEERTEKLPTKSGKYAIEKYIHIDVMCHIRLAIPGGGTTENEEKLMRVCGLAVVRKEPNSSEAQIIRVQNVGMDSQLKLLFAQTHTELTFLPKN